MVFSSSPIFLAHPNWQQLHPPHETSQLHQPPLPPPDVGGGAGGGLIRPGSMMDRARLAKVPQPEAGLKCPRCESTNTKFCYFNNYSLTQPRHFCKTCRRYWTRGGALRNVPAGGGCRRNKKIKKSSGSKSQEVTETKSTRSDHQSPFLPSLTNIPQYGVRPTGFQPQEAATSSDTVDQWTFPFLGGGDQPTMNLYHHYQSQGVEAQSCLVGGKIGLNLSRQFMGISENTQFLGGVNPWSEFSGINFPSSTSNLM